MNIKGIIIEDKEKGYFFGFVQQFPAVCAQGKTKEEVDEKINRYFKSFIARVSKEHVEMEMI